MTAREYKLFEEYQEVRPGKHQPVMSVREVWYDNGRRVEYVSEPVSLQADATFQIKEDITAILKCLNEEPLMLEDYRDVVEEY